MILCISFGTETINIWIPFIIALLAYFLSWRKDKLEKIAELNTYRELFINWVRIARNRTIAQANACEEFSVSATENLYIDRESISFTPLLYGKLNEIPLEKSISAFVFNSSGNKERNLKEYNSMIVSLTFLDAIENEIKPAYDEYSQEMNKLSDQFNFLFTSIDNAFINNVSDSNGDPNITYIKALNEIRNNWREQIPNGEISNAIHTFNKLINPSIEYVHEQFNRNKENKFLKEMYDLLEGMRIVQRKWLEYKKGYSERIKNYGYQIKEAYEGLEKTAKYFESSTKVVGIWKVK